MTRQDRVEALEKTHPPKPAPDSKSFIERHGITEQEAIARHGSLPEFYHWWLHNGPVIGPDRHSDDPEGYYLRLIGK